MNSTLTATVPLPFDAALEAVRGALASQGFGIITEIDMAATLKKKIGVEIAPQVILGACRPELAHRAITADPSVAALLPCNVVVRSAGEGRDATIVESIDPDAMLGFVADPGVLAEVVTDAKARLVAALDSLTAILQED
jgi:uncharacterized protein (DUF302 family)